MYTSGKHYLSVLRSPLVNGDHMATIRGQELVTSGLTPTVTIGSMQRIQPFLVEPPSKSGLGGLWLVGLWLR